MNRNDLKKLAMTRLREAKVLLLNGQYSGAYYLAGYAVECGLKACIAKQIKKFDFPDKKTVIDSYTHDLAALVKVAGLQPSLDLEIQRDQQGFGLYWKVVRQWTEQHRYQIIDQKTAEGLVEAISDAKRGVLKWLKRHW
jgi:HEPN domain-containing protein